MFTFMLYQISKDELWLAIYFLINSNIGTRLSRFFEQVREAVFSLVNFLGKKPPQKNPEHLKSLYHKFAEEYQNVALIVFH